MKDKTKLQAYVIQVECHCANQYCENGNPYILIVAPTQCYASEAKEDMLEVIDSVSRLEDIEYCGVPQSVAVSIFDTFGEIVSRLFAKQEFRIELTPLSSEQSEDQLIEELEKMFDSRIDYENRQ